MVQALARAFLVIVTMATSGAEPIYPKPLVSTFHAHKNLRIQCSDQAHDHLSPDGRPAARVSLPWEIVPGLDGHVSPGSALRRAMRRCETSICTRGIATDGTNDVRWVLHLGSLSETLVDAVDESYTLNVTDAGVQIAAPTVWGARHALHSLAQLAHRQSDGGMVLQYAIVADEPEYEYRGLMVSPGQRFMTPELLKTTLDGMEIARLNVL